MSAFTKSSETSICSRPSLSPKVIRKMADQYRTRLGRDMKETGGTGRVGRS